MTTPKPASAAIEKGAPLAGDAAAAQAMINPTSGALVQSAPLAKDDVIEQLVASVGVENLAEARGLGAAARLAVSAINKELSSKHTRRGVLQKEIRSRRRLAMALKAVTLLGGIGIISKRVAGAEQAIGIAILLATSVDAFAGNFLRLRDKIVEVGIIDEIEGAVAHATRVSIQVVRLTPVQPMAALRMYTDFWQNLHAMIVEKNDAVRQAAQKLELEITAQLDMAKKSGGDGK